MFVPASSGLALAVALLSMCCWGSWSNSILLFEKTCSRFELFYAVLSFVMFFFALFMSFAFGIVKSSGSGGEKSFLDDFNGSVEGLRFVYALGAGLVWNVANLMLCKGIKMLGLALAFPLCIGTSLVFGTALTYVVQPSGNAPLLFSGVFVAFVAVCLAAFVHRIKETDLKAREVFPEARLCPPNGNYPEEAPAINASSNAQCADVFEPSMTRKLMVCIIGGILMSLFNPLVTLAEKDWQKEGGGLSPYSEFTLFTFAAMISSMVLLPVILAYPIEGGKGVAFSVVRDEFRKIPLKGHVIAALGSSVWSLGTLANAVAGASGILSSAESYSIGQCANMVAIFWGFFYFKEFEGTSLKVKVLLIFVVALYALAIYLVAASSA